MIQPLQFTSNSNPYSAFDVSKTTVRTPEPPVLRNVPEDDVVLKAPLNETKEETIKQEVSKEKATEDTKPKESFYRRAKKKIVGFFRGLNNVGCVTKGALKGAGFGALAVGGTGIVVKNLHKAVKNQSVKDGLNIFSDTFKVAKKAITHSLDIITKSPVQNVKNLAKVPKKFFSEYLKGHKAIGAVSVLVGTSVLAFNVVKEKINANKKNAELEHSTNLGHTR